MVVADSASQHGSGSNSEFCNPMPTVDSFSPDELFLARFAVGVVRNGGAMFMGRLYECRVARVLGGELAPLGVWPWDVRLSDGTRIEVKSGTNGFALKGGTEADVWVFVRKCITGAQAPLNYYVASSVKVDQLRSLPGSFSVARAEKWLGAVPEVELSDAVRCAVQVPT